MRILQMIQEISEVGRRMLAFQEQLAKEYGYAPIGYNLFLGDVRQKYLDALPEWCKKEGDTACLYTLHGTLLARGYARIVVGDYGAFVEIRPEQMALDNLRIQPGQEYRRDDPNYRDRVKYLWYTTTDQSGIKIYLQKKTVSYADYLPGMFYASPYEITKGDRGSVTQG